MTRPPAPKRNTDFDAAKKTALHIFAVTPQVARDELLDILTKEEVAYHYTTAHIEARPHHLNPMIESPFHFEYRTAQRALTALEKEGEIHRLPDRKTVTYRLGPAPELLEEVEKKTLQVLVESSSFRLDHTPQAAIVDMATLEQKLPVAPGVLAHAVAHLVDQKLVRPMGDDSMPKRLAITDTGLEKAAAWTTKVATESQKPRDGFGRK